MAAINLESITPLTLAQIDNSDRVMVIDNNNTVVSVTTLETIADWIKADIEISDIQQLQLILDGKSDTDHQHVINDVVGLQAALDAKLDSSLVNIVGQTIQIKGETIVVPDAITGGNDARIPNPVTSGNYLRFIGTDGSIEERTTTQVKEDLGLNEVDNTSDVNKPVSTAQNVINVDLQTQINNLDLEGDGTTNLGTAVTGTNVTITSSTGDDAVINQASTSSAGVMSNIDKTHLDSTEFGADVTDTENVHQALGISSSGSTDSVLSQRGVFVPQLGGGTINITGNNLNVQLTEDNQLVPPLAIAVVSNTQAYLNTTDTAINANLTSAFPSTAWLSVAGGGGGGAILMTTDLQEVPPGAIAVIDFNNQYYNTGEGILMANTLTNFSVTPWIKVGRDQLDFTQENTQVFGISGKRSNVARVGAENNRVRLEIETRTTITSSVDWSFDPDTSDTIYTQSFSGTESYPTPAQRTVDNVLRDVADTITADDNFSWDGVISDCFIDEGAFTATGYSYQGWSYDRMDSPPPGELHHNGWARFSEDIGNVGLVTIPNVSELSITSALGGSVGIQYFDPHTTPEHWLGLGTPLGDYVYRVGDAIRFSFPSGAAAVVVVTEVNDLSTGEGQWIKFNVLSVEDSRLIGEDTTLTVQVLTGTRCIDIDLGTTETITSTFTTPGSNLVELPGDQGGGVASIYEVSYGGNPIGSFESFATSAEGDSRSEVGTNIASIINGSIQQPNNYYAIYNPTEFSVSAFQRFGDLDLNLFSVSVDNQSQISNPGDIAVSVDSFGRDFVLLDRAVLSREVYVDGLPTADPSIEGRVWNDNGTLKVSGETLISLTLTNIVVDNLEFTGAGETANVVVSGVPGTQFSISVVSTTPTGWLTAGALGATSGTIPADGTFETTITIPAATVTTDRTAAIRAINSLDADNVVTTGLFRQTHSISVGDGDLMVSTDSVTVGTVVTFSATITAGDPDFTVELYDADPSTGIPTVIQTATLNALGTHTFTGIDTAAFTAGTYNYWIRVADSDADVTIVMDSILVVDETYADFIMDSFDGKIITAAGQRRVQIEGKTATDIIVEYNDVEQSFRVLSNEEFTPIWDLSPFFDDSVSSEYTITDTSVSPNVVIESGSFTVSSEHVDVSSDSFHVGVPYFTFQTSFGGRYLANCANSANTSSDFVASFQFANNDAFTSGVIEFDNVLNNGAGGASTRTLSASSVSSGDYFFRASYTDSTGTKYSRVIETTIT